MAYSIDDMLAGLAGSRQMLLKHLDGLKNDQWDFRPYTQCFTIRQTLRHLILDDRSALDSLQSRTEPRYDNLRSFTKDVDALLAELDESHRNLVDYLRTNYADASLDTEVCIWGNRYKLPQGIAYLSSEDFYHMGQIAFLRQASDPDWDYYFAIYGIRYPAASPNPYP